MHDKPQRPQTDPRDARWLVLTPMVLNAKMDTKCDKHDSPHAVITLSVHLS